MGGDLKGALAEVVALEMNRPGWCELITILEIGCPATMFTVYRIEGCRQKIATKLLGNQLRRNHKIASNSKSCSATKVSGSNKILHSCHWYKSNKYVKFQPLETLEP